MPRLSGRWKPTIIAMPDCQSVCPLPGERQPIVFLQAKRGSLGNRVEECQQSRRPGAMAPALAANDAQAHVKGQQVGCGLPPLAQTGRDQKVAKPWLMLQRADIFPGVPKHRSSKNGREVRGAISQDTPIVETGSLIPIRIVDQRISFGPRLRPKWLNRRAFENCPRARQHGVNGRELHRQRIRVVRLVLLPILLRGQIPLPCIFRRRSVAAASQLSQSFPTERPVGRIAEYLPAGAQDRMRAGELVRRRADIHMRVVQDEVLDMDKLPVEPECRSRIVEMKPLHKSVAHR